jgi:hypothetical protein
VGSAKKGFFGGITLSYSPCGFAPGSSCFFKTSRTLRDFFMGAPSSLLISEKISLFSQAFQIFLTFFLLNSSRFSKIVYNIILAEKRFYVFATGRFGAKVVLYNRYSVSL